jgi:ABC-type oligopeptide transport system ATPase subunit
MEITQPLLEIRDLTVTFGTGKHSTVVVNGVSFTVNRGKTLGVVGQSGSGKTTLARAIMQLIPTTAGGTTFDGIDLATLSSKELRTFRRRMQMVFQDPGGSLNEYMRVGNIITEPLLVHGIASGAELESRAHKLLLAVGLEESDASRFPHEFSGGQKQRIAIARAIALRPEFLVCDEPTSALDVSVQATILNLLSDLRDEMKLTILFVTHDLAVVNQFCDDVIVMHNGNIVESGMVDEVIHNPKNEITQELLASSQPLNLCDSPSLIS